MMYLDYDVLKQQFLFRYTIDQSEAYYIPLQFMRIRNN